MENVQIVNLGGAAVQRQISGGPVIDPVVSERPAGRIKQVILCLMIEIEKIAEHGGGDKAARHGDDSGRDGSLSHGPMKRRAGYNRVKSGRRSADINFTPPHPGGGLKGLGEYEVITSLSGSEWLRPSSRLMPRAQPNAG